MEVRYRRRFLRDLAALPPPIRRRVETFAFETLPAAESLAATGAAEKLRGARDVYKVRFGSYRLGLRILDGVLVIERVLDRKDIYRVFP